MQVKQLSPDYYVSAQLSARDMRVAADYGIRTIINNRPDNEEAGQPKNADLRSAAEECGLAYVELQFDSRSLQPETVEALRQRYPTLEKPVLAFCRSGARSAMLWWHACGGGV